jgi:predicted RNase H-like HicB family nuclease
MKLTAAYKKVDDWWAAWVEEIPGVNTQGATLEEARENLKDALRMVLEANRELSEKEQEATRSLGPKMTVLVPGQTFVNHWNAPANPHEIKTRSEK